MDRLADLTDAVASRLDRRRFLAWAAGVFAGAAAAVVAPAFARAGPTRDQGLRTVLDRGPDAGLSPDLCAVYCSPYDCCSNGCCSGYYLFRCQNNCDHTYFYICSTPCTGFCLSQGC
jgi:hypothetical protein